MMVCVCMLVCLLTLIKSMHWLYEQRAWNMISGGTYIYEMKCSIAVYITYITYREWVSEQSQWTPSCVSVYLSFQNSDGRHCAKPKSPYVWRDVFYKCANASKTPIFLFIFSGSFSHIWFVSRCLSLPFKFPPKNAIWQNRLKCVVRSIRKHGWVLFTFSKGCCWWWACIWHGKLVTLKYQRLTIPSISVCPCTVWWSHQPSSWF